MKRGPGTTPCRQRNKLNLKNKRHKNAVYEELDTSKGECWHPWYWGHIIVSVIIGKPVSPSCISNVSSRDVSCMSSLLSPFYDESSQDVVWDDHSELLSGNVIAFLPDLVVFSYI